MGGNQSKIDNLSKQISSDVTGIMSDTNMELFTKVTNVNDINIGACKIGATGHVNVNQDNLVSINVKGVQKSVSSANLDTNITQKLAQTATRTKQMLALEIANSDTIKNDSEAINTAYTQIAQKTQTKCRAELLSKNLFKAGGEGCAVDNFVSNQDNLATMISDCTQDATNKSDVIKKLTQELVQTGVIETKNTLNELLQTAMDALTGLFKGPMVIIAVVVIVVVIVAGIIVFAVFKSKKKEYEELAGGMQLPVQTGRPPVAQDGEE